MISKVLFQIPSSRQEDIWEDQLSRTILTVFSVLIVGSCIYWCKKCHSIIRNPQIMQQNNN